MFKLTYTADRGAELQYSVSILNEIPVYKRLTPDYRIQFSTREYIVARQETTVLSRISARLRRATALDKKVLQELQNTKLVASPPIYLLDLQTG